MVNQGLPWTLRPKQRAWGIYMAFLLNSANALITGGASGLGYAVAELIVASGGRVALLDTDVTKGEAAAQCLGDDAVFEFCDVTSEDSVSQAIDRVLENFHEIRLTVNCAGISSGQRVVGRDGLMPLYDFQRIININLLGTFLVCRKAASAMQYNEMDRDDGARGVIINTASIAAYEGQVGQVAYSASKGGVTSMTLPLAREYAAFGVRVMTIAPGIISTPMFDHFDADIKSTLVAQTPFPKRPGHACEFAFLVKHIYENPMLNGEVIRLDAALRQSATNRMDI